jgi:hypothetical protein
MVQPSGAVRARGRRGRGAPLLCFAGLLVFCSAPAEHHDEVVVCESSAVMGSAKVDTQFPAVGIVGACTATLVRPDAALLAAHCFPDLVHGCRTKAETLRAFHLTLSPSGCVEDIHRADVDCGGERLTYALADIVVHPSAYEHNACVDARCLPGDTETGLVAAFDLALVRLVRRVTPPRGAAPLAVLTSITDDEASTFTLHRRLNVRRFEAAIGCERPQAFVVGWGANDLAAPVRIAGVADFFDGPTWDQVCQHVSACSEATPTSLCPRDDERHVFQAQGLRTHRGSSTAGAFDREITWLGDSGGPLLVRGGPSLGSVPELEEGFVVVGVLSGGGLPALPLEPGQDVEDMHPATFEPSNARFIEETLRAFATTAPDPAMLEPVQLDAGSRLPPIVIK